MTAEEDLEGSSIDQLLADYLAARDAGSAPQLEQWLAAHPQHAAELQDFLADAQLLDSGLEPIANPDAHGFARPGRRVKGFVMVRRIAVGGMASVWEAEQEGLRRRVALKLLTGGDHPAERVERFRREAEAAAALDHPHIVSIYEVGEQDGLPFFAMKLAAADLRRRLGRYKADPQATAVLVSKIARAVHYAHLHGVLHRDLKPANILLDDPPEGGPSEPLVADFGLAKNSTGEGLSEATRTGTVLGTPGYMSPEQASGRGNQCTVLTDVWGLGAVMYAMLTGRPPFVAEGELDTLQKVILEDPPPPRQITPLVDPDLETICLKCLEKAPDRRYASAAAVADELDRWLRGDPVLARPVGRGVRFRRWIWRNPLPTSLIVSLSLLFILTAGAAGGALYLSNCLADRNQELGKANAELSIALKEAKESREQMVSALSAAEHAREREARNAELARRAVAGYDRIGNSPEARQLGLRGIRRVMYEQALQFYGQYAAQNRDAKELDRDVADAHLKAAALCVELDRMVDAGRHADGAITIYNKLLAMDLEDDDIRLALALGWNTRATIHSRTPGQGPQALEALKEAARLAAPLAEREDDTEAAPLLAVVWTNMATGEASQNHVEEALRAAATARDYAERVIRRIPSTATQDVRLSRTAPLLEVDLFAAQLQWKVGRFTDAAARFRRVTAGWRPIVAISPKGMPASRLAFALRQYGELLTESKADNPLPVLEEALQLARVVAEASPEMPQHRWEIATCQGAIGHAHYSSGDPAAALPHLDVALSGLTTTTAGDIHFAPENRQRVTTLLLQRAATYADLERPDEALSDIRQAFRTDDGRMQFRLFLDFSDILCKRGDHAGAAKQLGAMLEKHSPDSQDIWAAVAMGWVRCELATESDKELSSTERQQLVSTYRSQAAAALRFVKDRENERVRKLLTASEFNLRHLEAISVDDPAPAR